MVFRLPSELAPSTQRWRQALAILACCVNLRTPRDDVAHLCICNYFLMFSNMQNDVRMRSPIAGGLRLTGALRFVIITHVYWCREATSRKERSHDLRSRF